jgi:hypothetical protein
MPALRSLSVAAALLLLAGCSAPAPGAGSGAPTASAAGSATATAEAGTTLPSDFPSGIPLIDGDIVTASTTSNGWEVWIASADPIDGYGQASSSLQDAGFSAIADQSINGAAGGLFDNGAYTVTVTAGSDAKYPDAVGYEVEKK